MAGKSVWYTDCDNIEKELHTTWNTINSIKWQNLSKEEFVKLGAKHFSSLWQIHPFREGNTRTIALLLAFFTEHYGYYFDQELLAQTSGYFRDSLVMASLDKFSEYEYLERILNDAISTEPVDTSEENLYTEKSKSRKNVKFILPLPLEKTV